MVTSRRSLSILATACSLFLGVLPALANGPELVLNGDFETTMSAGCDYNLDDPTFNARMSNATSFGGVDAEMDIMHPGCMLGPDAISGVVKIGMSVGDALSLGLSSALVAGHPYELTYYAFSEASYAPDGPATLQMGVASAPATLGTVVDSQLTPIGAWQQFTKTFVAAANSTYLTSEVSALGNAAWVHLDDVSLREVTACDATPAVGCITGSKNSLQVKMSSGGPSKNQIKWKLSGGGAIDQASLGNPVATRTYSLCIYDQTMNVSSLAAFVDITPSASWTNKDPKGFLYKDKTAVSDGVVKASLKTGEAGKSSVSVQAKGVNITMPTPISGFEYFDQDTKVLVQLVNDQSATCWQSEFTASTKNDGAQFKAKNP